MNTRSVLLAIVIICSVLLLAPYAGINIFGGASSSPNLGNSAQPEAKASLRRLTKQDSQDTAHTTPNSGEQLKEVEGLLK